MKVVKQSHSNKWSSQTQSEGSHSLTSEGSQSHSNKCQSHKVILTSEVVTKSF